jgi:hypothetical protein
LWPLWHYQALGPISIVLFLELFVSERRRVCVCVWGGVDLCGVCVCICVLGMGNGYGIWVWVLGLFVVVVWG